MQAGRSGCRPISVFATVTMSCLFLAASASAQGTGDAKRPAMEFLQDRTSVRNAELPEHAKAGTGARGTMSVGALREGRIKLSLPDGRSIEARLQRIAEDKSQGRLSWMGTVDEMQGSLLSLTQYRGVVTGFLMYGTETWEIMPGDRGEHILYQVDDEKLPEPSMPIVPDDEPGAGDRDGDSAVQNEPTVNAGGSGYVHDLLIVYTPAARTAYGRATLESMAQNAVAAANQAYLNSNIDLTLNLVGLQEINYQETGSASTSVYALRDKSDGKMDDVHRLRDDVGADIVTLLSQDSGCGWGFIMSYERAGFESSAFNAVVPRCLSNFTLAHEIGHNQGSDHNRENAALASTVFPYSYGFRRCTSDGSGFRTVMSYNCSGANRIARFSNPDVRFNGYATGVNNSEENARSISNTAATVAAFRASVSGGTAPNAPSSLAATANSADTITVTWRDNSANENGFRLERSTNGSNFSEIASLGAGTTEFVDGGLTASTTYYYRVRAYNGNGNSAYSNTDSTTTLEDDTTPLPPTDLIVE